jgi:NADPH-dependent glutamate synthase beta subunit-like oxidoreductase
MTVQEFKTKGKFKEFTCEPSELVKKVTELKEGDARYIAITGKDVDDGLELVYHFEKGVDVVNVSVKAKKKAVIPSITGVYLAAFLAENELQDHFGVKMTDLAIDFKGSVYRAKDSVDDTLLKPAVGPAPFMKRFFGRCREKCPGSVNAPKYIRQVANGDPVGAYNTVLEQAALPACLGRVCFAPCQEGCRQERNDEPIQIRLLKRYAADNTPSFGSRFKRAKLNGKKVAVVGGGPSGVSCAFYLGLMGYDVTVFERSNRCGGAMLWGIPKYRLPKETLEAEVQARFKEAGVTLKAGVEVKELKSLQKEFAAVYVAIGATDSSKLRIEGEEAEGVYDFRDLLKEVNVNNNRPKVGKRVAVIGGGNSSIDAARVAKRLGADSVTMYYRRTEREMPASPLEIHGALEEGVSFEYLVSPLKITPGKPLKLQMQHMRMGQPDETGKARSEPIPGSEFTIEVDSIITAIGQAVRIPSGFELEVSRRGTPVIDDNYATKVKGIWAGGDAVFGPKSVIEAIRDGRLAATAIDKSFGGKGWPEPSIDMDEFVARPSDLEKIQTQERVQVRELDSEERVKDFDEIELGYDVDEALREASRCWKCDWNE